MNDLLTINYFENKVCPHNCTADCRECDKIIKERKALEIIKEKRVNVFWLMECISCYTNALEKYNEDVLCKDIDCLTQEEYDLLKEVLLWK